MKKLSKHQKSKWKKKKRKKKLPNKIILGIDEVGRGPWAGPLVVGAVILESEAHLATEQKMLSENLWSDLADSKKLTAKKRENLAPLIHAHAAACGLGWVAAGELDRCGLAAALKLAARRAVKQVLAQKVKFDKIIIDGTVNFLADTPLADRVTLLKKADALVKEVSAASIIAKVARDNYMIALAEKYPAYGFENHVGYGTAAHQKALEIHGICPEHRQSFRPIREIIAQFSTESPQSALAAPLGDFSQKAPSHSQIGQNAEILVANYLKSQNHKIIAQNFKTKTYEIDLISIKNDQIFFTEVKSRKNSHHGAALAQITPTKQAQMRYAAENFLSRESNAQNFKNLQPFLAVAAVEGEPPAFKTWFPLVS